MKPLPGFGAKPPMPHATTHSESEGKARRAMRRAMVETNRGFLANKSWVQGESPWSGCRGETPAGVWGGTSMHPTTTHSESERTARRAIRRASVATNLGFAQAKDGSRANRAGQGAGVKPLPGFGVAPQCIPQQPIAKASEQPEGLCGERWQQPTGDFRQAKSVGADADAFCLCRCGMRERAARKRRGVQRMGAYAQTN